MIKIPDYTEADERLKHKQATPLDQFILEFEPATPQMTKTFRSMLREAIEWSIKQNG